MKTLFLKPGFEFIFALSLMVILGLPPMLMAQNQKDVEIKIENGDTTVNGKSIKYLSAKDRRDALRDIKHLSEGAMANSGENGTHVYFYRHRDTTMAGRMKNEGHRPMITQNIVIHRDSSGNFVETRPGMGTDNMTIMRDRMNGPDRNNEGPFGGGPMMKYERRNSQSFNYITTDNNGTSTHISFRVSDVTNEDLKRMPHVEGPRLEISDLNLVPEFSSGKILLLFSLTSKTIADVKLVGSDGKILWSDKASGGHFTKAFAMGLNGVYYLQVKQGSGVAVKRIAKEE